jgi:hypothetical protein
LATADVCLRQQILNVSILVPLTPQPVEEFNRVLVLTHSDIAQAEVEFESILIPDISPSCDQMRNSFLESPLPRESCSPLQLFSRRRSFRL